MVGETLMLIDGDADGLNDTGVAEGCAAEPTEGGAVGLELEISGDDDACCIGDLVGGLVGI